MMPTKLYKTTIVIYSEYNPEGTVEIEDLARDAMRGDSYCSDQRTEEVNPNATTLPDGVREFFMMEEE